MDNPAATENFDNAVNMTNMQDYKEFSDTGASKYVFSWRNWSFQRRELILAACLAVTVVVCVVLIGVSAHYGSVSPTSAGQSGTGDGSSSSTSNICLQPYCLEASSYVLLNLNHQIDPCTDFHKFACDKWGDIHKLKPDESERTVFKEMHEQNEEKVRALLDQAIRRDTDWATERKLKDFYLSCIDEFQKNKLGAKPFLDIIVNVTGGWFVLGTYNERTWDVNTFLKKVHVDFWTDVLFHFRVGTDRLDNSKRVIEVDLGGLGMPWPYYIRADVPQIQIAYKKYIRRVAELMVRDSLMKIDKDQLTARLDQFVEDVYNFEFELANITLYTLPSDDPHADEQRVTLDELNAMAPIIDWRSFFMYMFRGAGVDGNTKIVLLEKDYLSMVSHLLQTYLGNTFVNEMKRVLNNYFLWQMAHTYVEAMSTEYVQVAREFYEVTTGNTEFPETWRFCFNLMAEKLDLALGSLFVQDHFVDRSKPAVHQLVDLLKDRMFWRLDELTWMDQITMWRARTKVKQTTDKLGYADILMDDDALDVIYEPLKMHRDDFFQNLQSLASFEREEWNRQLKSGEDRSVWRLKAYEVDAFYSNTWNEVLVPAGFLQFPLFDLRLPNFMNYGGIVHALAKEIIFAVDETGGYYLANGTFSDWWTNYTTYSYLKERQCIIDYYSNKSSGPYIVKEHPKGITVKVDGRAYARNAISDIGGLRNAYRGWKLWQEQNAEKLAPGLGMDNNQAFFVAYAQTYCNVRRDELAFQQASLGLVPEDIRVNAALSQLKEFSDTFKCPVGSAMNPPKKCNLF